MRNRADEEGRSPEAGLTTEDLAHPVTEAGQEPPTYPGEATGDREETRENAYEDAYEDTYEDTEGGTATAAEPGTETVADQDTAAPAGLDTPAETTEDESQSLLGTTEAEEFRQTWSDIQGRFVDDPRDAVRSADALVAEVMQTLAGSFAAHKQGLEGQWQRGEEVATEDLRQALQHYRSFFNRLLKT